MYKTGEKKRKKKNEVYNDVRKTHEISISSYDQENNRGNWAEKKGDDNTF